MGNIVSEYVSCHRQRPQIPQQDREEDEEQGQYQIEFEDPSVPFPLSDLPVELLIYHILPYLTYMDLCSLSQTNKSFKTLIDANDKLWKNAIHCEMLDDLPPNPFYDHQEQPQCQIFDNEKSRFEYLYQRRRRRSLNCAASFNACGRRPRQSRLLYKYITVQPSINIIQKFEQDHELYVYYSHGKPKNNITKDKMDNQSKSLLTEAPTMEERNAQSSHFDRASIRCLKCKAACYYPVCSSSQPQPYHWFVSYLAKSRKNGWDSERIEVIEIYCGQCQRFSLWKDINQGYGTSFVLPKRH